MSKTRIETAVRWALYLLLEEQYRADITRDGYKDIFIKGGFSLIGGTLGFGFTMILSRINENSLIAPVFYET